MATLVWDQVGERIFETGVSKAVLYDHDGVGIPWNGITSIDEDGTNEVDPVYFDGVKINDIVTVGNFSGTLRAFTYPEEFLEHEGILKDQSGFYVLNQPPTRFGLSYQTKIGDDVDGIESGYKIHLLYNLTAVPEQKNYETLSLDMQPMEFEWTITAVPEEIVGFLPTAHIIFDSTKINHNLLQDIEDILYGDDITDARLPSLKGISAFIRKWDRLIITDNGDGTWTAESNEPGIIVMWTDTEFIIISDTAEYLDPDTYTIESSDKDEEDL